MFPPVPVTTKEKVLKMIELEMEASEIAAMLNKMLEDEKAKPNSPLREDRIITIQNVKDQFLRNYEDKNHTFW